MTLEFSFSGIRIQESNLTPVDWNLTVNIIAPVKKGRPREESEHKASMMYQRLYFWLDTNLHNSVMVDAENEDDLYLANLTSNIALFCPGNPGDDLLIQLIHYKLSTLAGTELVIGETHLKGNDTSLQYTFDSAGSEYMLPYTIKEYYPEGVARDIVPWWLRDDGFCFEFIKPEGAESNEIFDSIIDPMDEFENIIEEISASNITMLKEPAKIIKMEKWKPKQV